MHGPEFLPSTPPELRRAVYHLGFLYRFEAGRLSTQLRRVCRAYLNPDAQWEGAFSDVLIDFRPHCHPGAYNAIERRVCRGTAGGYFHGFLALRTHLIARLSQNFFQRFLDIGKMQSHLISEVPWEWAEAQAFALAKGLESETLPWIVAVCDSKTILEKSRLRAQGWAMPLFLIHDDFENDLSEGENSWEKQDEEWTSEWLNYLSWAALSEVTRYIRFSAGNAAVSYASTDELRPGSYQPAQISASHPFPTSIFEHSNDYSSIIYKGETVILSARQATVIRVLHEAHKRSFPQVTKARLLSRVGSTSTQISDIFKNCSLWGTLVRFASRGMYSLDLPRGVLDSDGRLSYFLDSSDEPA